MNTNGVGRVEKKARQGGMAEWEEGTHVSRPILLQAKQSLLIIPAETSSEKQTASSLNYMWL